MRKSCRLACPPIRQSACSSPVPSPRDCRWGFGRKTASAMAAHFCSLNISRPERGLLALTAELNREAIHIHWAAGPCHVATEEALVIASFYSHSPCMRVSPPWSLLGLGAETLSDTFPCMPL